MRQFIIFISALSLFLTPLLTYGVIEPGEIQLPPLPEEIEGPPYFHLDPVFLDLGEDKDKGKFKIFTTWAVDWWVASPSWIKEQQEKGEESGYITWGFGPSEKDLPPEIRQKILTLSQTSGQGPTEITFSLDKSKLGAGWHDIPLNFVWQAFHQDQKVIGTDYLTIRTYVKPKHPPETEPIPLSKEPEQTSTSTPSPTPIKEAEARIGKKLIIDGKEAPEGKVRLQIEGKEISLIAGERLGIVHKGKVVFGELELKYKEGKLVGSKSGKELKLMPGEIEVGSGEKILKTELVDSEKELKYVVETKKYGKILWLFPVSFGIKYEIDATSGSKLKEKRPWWEFFVTTVIEPPSPVRIAPEDAEKLLPQPIDIMSEPELSEPKLSEPELSGRIAPEDEDTEELFRLLHKEIFWFPGMNYQCRRNQYLVTCEGDVNCAVWLEAKSDEGLRLMKTYIEKEVENKIGKQGRWFDDKTYRYEFTTKDDYYVGGCSCEEAFNRCVDSLAEFWNKMPSSPWEHFPLVDWAYEARYYCWVSNAKQVSCKVFE